MYKPTVDVHLWSGLRTFTDGIDVVAVEAATTGEVLKTLVEKYPGLEGIIEAGVSVAVDGKIIATSLHYPVGPENEIFLLKRIKGG
jgi:molybdopterin synthase sulfur carrier subunit